MEELVVWLSFDVVEILIDLDEVVVVVVVTLGVEGRPIRRCSSSGVDIGPLVLSITGKFGSGAFHSCSSALTRGFHLAANIASLLISFSSILLFKSSSSNLDFAKSILKSPDMV